MADWQIYTGWVVILSVITFILYGVDKAQARRGGRRVRELYLHGLALLGGFPGGWFGRSVFRHKTDRAFFGFILVLSTVIHLVLVYFLFMTKN